MFSLFSEAQIVPQFSAQRYGHEYGGPNSHRIGNFKDCAPRPHKATKPNRSSMGCDEEVSPHKSLDLLLERQLRAHVFSHFGPWKFSPELLHDVTVIAKCTRLVGACVSPVDYENFKVLVCLIHPHWLNQEFSHKLASHGHAERAPLHRQVVPLFLSRKTPHLSGEKNQLPLKRLRLSCDKTIITDHTQTMQQLYQLDHELVLFDNDGDGRWENVEEKE
mmetsp:Transcript_8297/g.10497  ORF Transcript_8297/g.10497 Transcript_8297/m.10497 type:complete len:219 (+) Transcript_8297:386-1042(+)